MDIAVFGIRNRITGSFEKNFVYGAAEPPWWTAQRKRLLQWKFQADKMAVIVYKLRHTFCPLGSSIWRKSTEKLRQRHCSNG
jgi:hypothetical protein